MDLRFEWDEVKAHANQAKHGVDFDEAITVFGDPFAITIFDDAHSQFEDRFIELGLSADGRVLVIVYVIGNEAIRIISCGRATAREQSQYEQRPS